MDILVFALALVTFISTLVGGAVTLRYRAELPLFFSFAAGSLISVAFLDILPESLDLARTVGFPLRYIMVTVVLSFFAYSTVNRLFVTHCIGEECDDHSHVTGQIGAGSLVLHSFLDGISIGTAFKVSSSLGLLVALAVIFHDFTDGMNTVTLMLKNRHHVRGAMLFLAMDALAPVLGVAAMYFVSIPESLLVIILSVFVGEFIYLGASSLLPETQKYSSAKSLGVMAAAILLIIALTSIL